jgi:replicative DNA helicase
MVQAKCNYVKAIAGLDLIIFDYLQISGSDQRYHSRADEIGSLARAYKAIAMDFNVPFFLLSQLGRSVEDVDNKSKKPRMRHLKESGGIEESANTILFLFREYKYFPESESESKNKTTVICAKQRDGEADIETDIYSDLSIGKYADLEEINI